MRYEEEMKIFNKRKVKLNTINTERKMRIRLNKFSCPIKLILIFFLPVKFHNDPLISIFAIFSLQIFSSFNFFSTLAVTAFCVYRRAHEKKVESNKKRNKRCRWKNGL
jgi:hypothetical protein